MTAKISLDKAGRLVLPKALREEMQLSAGDTLVLESEGERIMLRPVRARVLLQKERGVWVYQGEPSNASLPDLIDQQRAERLRDILSR
jgi:AbrB family transcriptional regulator (stage V sporulation protein T)